MRQADGVELIDEEYSLTEHRQLLQENAFQCLVFADAGPSLKACEDIFGDLFRTPVPRTANGGFLLAPERTLGVPWK